MNWNPGLPLNNTDIGYFWIKEEGYWTSNGVTLAGPFRHIYLAYVNEGNIYIHGDDRQLEWRLDNPRPYTKDVEYFYMNLDIQQPEDDIFPCVR